ncbi:MAG TPA: glycosyltransferase 87 family protein [Candidatus Polarisedimenticolia bacterium]|nr:glycosyltransferase 87 family protein [Candidatus Polarisedimenticolia bacterium]
MRLRPSTLVFVVLVACAVLLLAGRAAVTVRDAELSDFRCFYEAGRLVRGGLDPYDPAMWASATKQDPTRLPPCPDTFAYPLWTAMAFAPLSVLSEPAALGAWEVVLFASLVGGVAMLARAWPMFGGAKLLLPIVLWSQPAFSAIANAQMGPIVFVGLAAMALSLERTRERIGAAAWCLLLIKPNIVAIALLGVPLFRSRRLIAYVVLFGSAILLLSLALVPTWPIDVLRVIFGQQLLADRDLGTLSALAIVLGLPSAIGVGAAIVTLGLFVAVLPRRTLWPREIVAVLAASSFLVTPYARPHDEVALAVCWASALALANVAHDALRSAMVAAVIGIALVLPWVLTLLSLFGFPLAAHILVTLATAALTAYSLRRLEPVSRSSTTARTSR